MSSNPGNFDPLDFDRIVLQRFGQALLIVSVVMVPDRVNVPLRRDGQFGIQLAGPQGTLFGKNATGGNILFEPMKPQDSNGGYVRAEYGNFNNRRIEGAINVAPVPDRVMVRIAGEVGRRDGYTPKHKLSLGATYETSLGNAGDLAMGVNYVSQSKVSTAQTNGSFYRFLPGYGLLNASLDLRNVGGRPLDIGLFASNITDEEKPVGVADFYAGAPGVVGLTYSEPRMYGIRIGYRFGD